MCVGGGGSVTELGTLVSEWQYREYDPPFLCNGLARIMAKQLLQHFHLPENDIDWPEHAK